MLGRDHVGDVALFSFRHVAVLNCSSQSIDSKRTNQSSFLVELWNWSNVDYVYLNIQWLAHTPTCLAWGWRTRVGFHRTIQRASLGWLGCKNGFSVWSDFVHTFCYNRRLSSNFQTRMALGKQESVKLVGLRWAVCVKGPIWMCNCGLEGGETKVTLEKQM